MKKAIVAMLCAVLLFAGCRKNKNSDSTDEGSTVNVQKSVSVLACCGLYEGVIPCADCEGIQVVVKLNDDMSYNIKEEYLGEANCLFEETGFFDWDEEKSIITLKMKEYKKLFKFEGNAIVMLDADSNRVVSELAEAYVLRQK